MQQTAVQIEQHIQDIAELFFAVTNNQATKVGADGILEGLLYGIAKTGQVINKDVLNLIADNNIDTAFGDQLDNFSSQNGYPARYGATSSSTYLFLVATSGTTYISGTHQFVSNNGKVFNLDSDITISSIGFAYVKINSIDVGVNSNVAANSITKCTPAPTGHLSCWNDYIAVGGRDVENDTDYRNRLKQTLNIFARGTLSQLEQVFIKINNRVLKIYKGGYSSTTGSYIIYVASINSVDFSPTEFAVLVAQSESFLSITEQNTGIELRNVNYLTIDFSARVDIQTGVDINKVRTSLQRSFQRKYDYRYLNYGDVISRLELMLITQRTTYINRLLDTYFLLNGMASDITLPNITLPRWRSFILYDLNGNIISDNNNSINPTYSTFYNNYSDAEFQALLTNI